MSSIVMIFLVIGFVSSAALSLYFFRRFSDLGLVDRLLKAQIPLSVYVLALLFAKKLLDVPTFWHTAFLCADKY